MFALRVLASCRQQHIKRPISIFFSLALFLFVRYLNARCRSLFFRGRKIIFLISFLYHFFHVVYLGCRRLFHVFVLFSLWLISKYHFCIPNTKTTEKVKDWKAVSNRVETCIRNVHVNPKCYFESITNKSHRFVSSRTMHIVHM